MTRDEMREAFVYAEDALGDDLFPLEPPRLEPLSAGDPDESRIISQIVIRKAVSGRPSAAVKPTEIGQALTIVVESRAWREHLRGMRGCLEPLLAANPFTLVDWIFTAETFPDRGDLEALLSWSLRLDHLLNREDFATHAPVRSTQVFIKRKAWTGDHPILTAVPVVGKDAPPSGSGFGSTQRACEVTFPPGLSETDEDEQLRWLRERLGSEGRLEFRLADGVELEAGRRAKDPRLRAVCLAPD